MTGSATPLHRWIFLLTAGLLFAAATLRTVLAFSDDAALAPILTLLLAWLVLFVLEGVVTPRLPSAFPVYMIAQTVIVVALLVVTDSGDFYAVLFGVLGMQAMQRLGLKMALLWIALFTPLTLLALSYATRDLLEAIAFTAIYTGVDVILAFFAFSSIKADEERAHNETLSRELETANAEIEAYSRRIERLATAGERHRMARELHDSVTQTVFSMNLTAQSAGLLATKDREAADAQLGRLEELGRDALAEIEALGSELATTELGERGLAEALSRYLAERAPADGLKVTLDVHGRGEPGALSAEQELCLFRIVQEALNNVVKHAGADEAAIRLRLSPPRRVEIEDHGRGFDVRRGEEMGGMGLAGMRERAAEIGWSLQVTSARGEGTRIVVEEPGVNPRGGRGD